MRSLEQFVILSPASSQKTLATEENVALDERDLTILRALSANSRISYRDLSSLIHLSPNATAERVQRLQTHGVIQQFTIEVSPSALGLHLQAFVDVKLQRGISMEVFEKSLCKIIGVREAASLTGAFDARLRIECRDPEHLGLLIEQIRKETGVQETSSTVICRELKLRP